MTGGITPNVVSIGPLNKPALDGSTRVKRRERAPITPKPVTATSWVCPACGRTTEDAEDQARHVAVELTRAYSLISELGVLGDDLAAVINSMPEELVLAARRQLSDDDCRRARMAWMRLHRQGVRDKPVEIEDGNREYRRRKESVRLAYKSRGWVSR